MFQSIILQTVDRNMTRQRDYRQTKIVDGTTATTIMLIAIAAITLRDSDGESIDRFDAARVVLINWMPLIRLDHLHGAI